MVLARCAVIGKPIEHSLSPLIHHAFAEQVALALNYEKMLGDEHLFEQQVKHFFTVLNGIGANITLPFKQRAFDMATVRSERCVQAKAANTLWYKDDVLHADNTDGVGLVRDLSDYKTIKGQRILILGAGGAARGIIHPLLEMSPLQLVVINRTVDTLHNVQRDFPEIDCMPWSEVTGEFDLIINATSAGVHGECISLPKTVLSKKTFGYDLSYKYKGVTPFVAYIHQQGGDAVDGLGMLVEQAAESFYIWHGLKPNTKPVLQLLRTV